MYLLSTSYAFSYISRIFTVVFLSSLILCIPNIIFFFWSINHTSALSEIRTSVLVLNVEAWYKSKAENLSNQDLRNCGGKDIQCFLMSTLRLRQALRTDIQTQSINSKTTIYYKVKEELLQWKDPESATLSNDQTLTLPMMGETDINCFPSGRSIDVTYVEILPRIFYLNQIKQKQSYKSRL